MRSNLEPPCHVWPLAAAAGAAKYVFEEGPCLDRLDQEIQRVHFRTGQIQQVADQPPQVVAAGVDVLEVAAHSGRQVHSVGVGRRQSCLAVAEDHVERRPELVADIRQQARLEAVGIFGLPAFSERAGVPLAVVEHHSHQVPQPLQTDKVDGLPWALASAAQVDNADDLTPDAHRQHDPPVMLQKYGCPAPEHAAQNARICQRKLSRLWIGWRARLAPQAPIGGRAAEDLNLVVAIPRGDKPAELAQ